MSDVPSWLGSGKAKKQKQNRRSAAHERRLAEEVGGKVQTGSGNTWKAPQDVRSDTHLIQHKYTDQRSYSVTVKTLEGLVRDAERSGREAALVLDFEAAGLRVTAVVERV